VNEEALAYWYPLQFNPLVMLQGA
jgi:hypothetical protein